MGGSCTLTRCMMTCMGCRTNSLLHRLSINTLAPWSPLLIFINCLLWLVEDTSSDHKG
ncbi:unnamed protein product [Haemonchus placei]|uniref:Uncharacterized protein n=1 Tax=Haemonchus placei TaxID=6290 RepID=A0A3P7SKF2_HAEPC|nr:unnamed protein product [Haemonchus placei]